MSYDPNQPDQAGQSYSNYEPPQAEPQRDGVPPPPSYASGPQGAQGTTQYGAPYGFPYGGPYGAPPYPYVAPYPFPEQRRSSRSWLWIVGGIFVVLLLLGGALWFALATGVFASPAATVSNYYNAVEQQDYHKAFSYFHFSNSDSDQQSVEASYVALSRLADAFEGELQSYQIASTEVSGDTATVVAHLIRANRSYDATLQLTRIGSDWKITNLSTL
jgi:hypothetical protein